MNKRDDKMVLMDRKRIQRSLKRMAHQINEDVEEARSLKIVGIQERGYFVAQYLSNILSDICSEEPICGSLPVKPGHMEDDTTFDPNTIQQNEDFILLVDDVIFSGRTMFDAMHRLTENKVPAHLHCVVLIDRGHRQLPVEARYRGMRIPTKLNEHVEVHVSDKGEVQEVNLYL